MAEKYANRIEAAVREFQTEAERVTAAAQALGNWWEENAYRFVTDPGSVPGATEAVQHTAAVVAAEREVRGLIGALQPTEGQRGGTLAGSLIDYISGQVREAVTAAQGLEARRKREARV